MSKRKKLDNFDMYVDCKVDPENDYSILLPNTNMRVHTDILLLNEEERKLTETRSLISQEQHDRLLERGVKAYKAPSVTLIRDELLYKYHPDNVDVNEFWKLSTKHFPMYSVAGGNSNCKTMEEVNNKTFDLAKRFGVLSVLEDYLNANPKAKTLEIGPGYGNICYHINENYPLVEYYGLDVHPLFEWPTLYKGDGKTIPTDIPNELDSVYSFNVFQHLSKSQRSSYYQEIFNKLKVGGTFIFSMFIWSESNKELLLWGCKDFNGRYYCKFFKQFTEIDSDDEIYEELNSIGFTIDKVINNDRHNYWAFKCVKESE